MYQGREVRALVRDAASIMILINLHFVWSQLLSASSRLLAGALAQNAQPSRPQHCSFPMQCWCAAAMCYAARLTQVLSHDSLQHPILPSRPAAAAQHARLIAVACCRRPTALGTGWLPHCNSIWVEGEVQQALRSELVVVSPWPQTLEKEEVVHQFPGQQLLLQGDVRPVQPWTHVDLQGRSRCSVYCSGAGWLGTCYTHSTLLCSLLLRHFLEEAQVCCASEPWLSKHGLVDEAQPAKLQDAGLMCAPYLNQVHVEVFVHHEVKPHEREEVGALGRVAVSLLLPHQGSGLLKGLQQTRQAPQGLPGCPQPVRYMFA